MLSLSISVRPICYPRVAISLRSLYRKYSEGHPRLDSVSPRTAGIGHAIEDEYAAIREQYGESFSFQSYLNAEDRSNP